MLSVYMALPTEAQLEAVLFASGEPLSRKRLAAILAISEAELADVATSLATTLEGRGLALIETKDELELRTAPDASEVVKTLRESELSRDLGKASLETLAMILYKGGATRGEIDWVRGVNSGAAIRSLTMRGLITRMDDPNDKRRARYAATIDALAHLGVRKPEDLPRYAELVAALTDAETRTPDDA